MNLYLLYVFVMILLAYLLGAVKEASCDSGGNHTAKPLEAVRRPLSLSQLTDDAEPGWPGAAARVAVVAVLLAAAVIGLRARGAVIDQALCWPMPAAGSSPAPSELPKERGWSLSSSYSP